MQNLPVGCHQNSPERTKVFRCLIQRPLEWLPLSTLARGAQLAESAVVKAIEELTARGTSIHFRHPADYAYEPNGRILSPDLLCAQLPTQWWGKRVIVGDEIPSTIDVAKAASVQPSAHGTAVLANQQTQGRGRGENRWLAPKGADLLLSFLVKADPALGGWIPPPSLLSLYAATAAARVLDTAHGICVKIKWPNDLIWEGKKLGGILAECLIGQGCFLISMGLNVNSQPTDWPESIRGQTVSLAMIQPGEWERELLAAQLGATWELSWDMMMRDRGDGVRGDWNRYGDHFGKTATLNYRGTQMNGFTKSIDRNGDLVFTAEDGRILHLTPEDVRGIRQLDA